MKKLLIVSIIINIGLVCYLVGKRIYYKLGYAEPAKTNILLTGAKDSIVTLTYNKYHNFDLKRRMYATLPIKKTDILFLGDSQTEQFPINEMFQTLNIKNRGISGSASADVLKTATNTTIPNTVFILDGINDYYYNVPQDSTVKHMDNLIDLLRKKNSSVKIFVQSTLPVADVNITKQVVELDKKNTITV